jgi:hypothetical protein
MTTDEKENGGMINETIEGEIISENSVVVLQQGTTSDINKKEGGITGKGFIKGDLRINRKGRPRLGESAADRANNTLSGPVTEDNPEYSIEDGIWDVLARLALAGNLQAIEQLISRKYGKIPDVIKLNQPEEDQPDFTILTPEERDTMNKIITKATYGPNSEEYLSLINPPVWDLEPDEEEEDEDV